MPDGFDKLAIPLDLPGEQQVWLVLTQSSSEISQDHDDCTPFPGILPKGWKGVPSEQAENWILPAMAVSATGVTTVIRLLETRAYDWALRGPVPDSLDVTSSLESKHRQHWTIRSREGKPDTGTFNVVNHLGHASFGFESEGMTVLKLGLEFISLKLDFDKEYRSMTGDIALFCEQLLLDWNAPTSLSFSANPEKQPRLLLEQFLFLRNFLSGEKIGRIIEAIRHNPHTELLREREWKPAGAATSADYLENPSVMLRNWRNRGNRRIPGEVMDIRKTDSHDTAPNRFLKFALERFRRLCTEVQEIATEGSPIQKEAGELRARIDSILSLGFFRGLGRLSRLPLDNQTLQKREGYREILRAWILTDAAASLSWEGNEDCYEGMTRDVATLYEYWIFLKLHELLEEIPGMKRRPGGKDLESFITERNGGIKLNLKSGRHSLARFQLDSGLCVDLHYERTFFSNDQATSGASYSRRFRPDYTLSIYQGSFSSEEDAMKAGQASHLHFDAKYRAEQLKDLFGEDGDDLVEEKSSGKATSTYNRGDLLKMHTYNDALRQTIGSYVLYPGDGDPKKMRKFHEIAPGVGAFVMKPDNQDCLDSLKLFLEAIFKHQQSHFTQFRYLADTGYQTHRKKPGIVQEETITYEVARPDAPCVLLFLHNKKKKLFKEHRFAYCHAVPPDGGKKLNINLSTEVGSEFIPFGGEWGKEATGLGWRAKIRGARFLARNQLLEYIKRKGLNGYLNPSSVDHYLLFEFSKPTTFKKLNVSEAHRKHRSGSKYMAVTCTWEELLGSNESGNPVKPKAPAKETPAVLPDEEDRA